MPRKETIETTQAELEKHEAECAIRYKYVLEKLEGLHKRIWRIEAYGNDFNSITYRIYNDVYE